MRCHQRPRLRQSSHRLSKSGQAGFTLLEVLVVVVIVGILAALSFPSWNAFLVKRRVVASQDEILRALRQAQANSARTKENWAVSFDAAEARYAVHLERNTTETSWQWTKLPTDVSLATVSLANGLGGFPSVAFDNQGNACQGYYTSGTTDCFNPALGDGTPGNALTSITLVPQSNASTTGDSRRCVIIAARVGSIKTASRDICP